MVLTGEREGLEKNFFDLCTKVLNELGLELYDLDYLDRNQELKVFIQDPSTKTAVIEDCVKVDHALTPYIDELDWMPEQLRLEVSSPGVFRSLKSLEHFSNSLNEIIEVSLVKKLNEDEFDNLPKSLKGEKKLRGTLLSVDSENLVLKIKDYELNLMFTNIKKANVSPDF